MTEISLCVHANNYLQSLIIGDRVKCTAVTKEYLSLNSSITSLYEEVIKVSLYEVGRLWETNKISVATEHIATAITEGILNGLFEQVISNKRVNKKVVVACVEKEQHQVGIKMVADVFEMNGWESYFLGTGIPINELVHYIDKVKPDIIALSLSVYFNFSHLLQHIVILKSHFPTIQVIIGGQAFQNVSAEVIDRLGDVVLLSDLYILRKYIETYH